MTSSGISMNLLSSSNFSVQLSSGCIKLEWNYLFVRLFFKEF